MKNNEARKVVAGPVGIQEEVEAKAAREKEEELAGRANRVYGAEGWKRPVVGEECGEGKGGTLAHMIIHHHVRLWSFGRARPVHAPHYKLIVGV